MQLYELVDVDEMRWLNTNGYLNEQFHPTEPLAILNYSKRAVPGAECWAYESLHYCRGLIYDTWTGEIVARPFKKFWNYGEPGAAEIPLDARVQVTDKWDGSLGILYREPHSGKLAIATRGSFISEQAVHGTRLLREKYPDFDWISEDWTMLFEIVYPENRIVLDYGARDDLVLLGGVWDLSSEDGPVLGPEGFPEWKGPKVEVVFEGKFSDALALPRDRQNAEGYVIRRLQNDDTVKLKQQDYVELHRIVFGLSEKMVWKHLRDLGGTGDLKEGLPEEFWPWVDEVEGRILGEAARLEESAREEFAAIHDNIDWPVIADDLVGSGQREVALQRASTKAFALEVAKLDTPNKWMLFMLWNGRGGEIRQTLIEKHLEPVGRTAPPAISTGS